MSWRRDLDRVEEMLEQIQLNPEQRRAVNAISETWDLPTGEFNFPIVEGPPGTGKTFVGVIASAQYISENSSSARPPQIVYLCYTHYAADRALEALIRLGFTPNLVKRIVDRARWKLYENSPIREYYIAFDSLYELNPNKRRELRSTPVLISTIHCAMSVTRGIFNLHRRPLIIIDEFSQVSKALFFSLLSVAGTSERNPDGYALLGDPNQLPVVSTQPLLRENIGIYIMARLRPDYEPHQLRRQYRMNAQICEVVNALREALNTYRLEPATQEVGNRTLTSLGYEWDPDLYPEFEEILDPRVPCVIINTDSLPNEEQTGLGESKYYVEEAILAARLARAFHESFARGQKRLQPRILAPYSAQVGVIKSNLPQDLRDYCITVYQSQGHEYDCVIVSFTRKNPYGRIGFLKERDLRAQAYVACSRAKAKLVILISRSTFEGYRDYRILLERAEERRIPIIDADPNWVRLR